MDDAIEVLTIVATVLAICTNSLLAFLTVQPLARVSIGNYRLLLLAFAISNIIYSLHHSILRPVIYFTDNGFILFSALAPSLPYYGGIIVCTLSLLLSYQTFVLLALHFLYRYNVICRPVWLEWIEGWRVWHVSLLVTAVILVYNSLIALNVNAYCSPTDYSNALFATLPILQHYNLDVKQHSYFAGMFKVPDGNGGTKWYAPTILACLGTMALIVATSIPIIFCIIQIRRAFKAVVMSKRTCEMQQQLFRALLFQTLVPAVCIYVPMTILNLMPLAGVDLGRTGTIIIPITVIFPATDPLVVIWFIKVFRHQVASMPIFKRFNTKTKQQPASSAYSLNHSYFTRAQ